MNKTWPLKIKSTRKPLDTQNYQLVKPYKDIRKPLITDWNSIEVGNAWIISKCLFWLQDDAIKKWKGNQWKLQKKVKEKWLWALDSQVIDIVFSKRKNFPKNTRSTFAPGLNTCYMSLWPLIVMRECNEYITSHSSTSLKHQQSHLTKIPYKDAILNAKFQDCKHKCHNKVKN